MDGLTNVIVSKLTLSLLFGGTFGFCSVSHAPTNYSLQILELEPKNSPSPERALESVDGTFWPSGFPRTSTY